jgi:hypothetical protein
MKKTLCRRAAAVLTVLLALALFPCLVLAETPDRKADTTPPVPVSEEADEYEYDPDAPWLYYDMTEAEYYEEFEPWRAAGQTEEEYWDAYYENMGKEMRAEALRAFGFTDTDIPNVVANGRALNFTGAKPLTRDGATLIPARAVLEALDAEALYDGKAKTLTAALGDTRVVFTVGSRTVAVTRDGRTTEIEAAAAPFIDGATASAYVPLRALAEGLGLELHWNDFYKVAEIVDKAALIARIDADFTVFNALLESAYAAAVETYASGKAEKTDVNLTAEFDAHYRPYSYYADESREAEEGAAAFAGAFTILAGRSGLDIAGEAKLDVTGFESLLGDLEQDAEMTDMLRDLKNGVPFSFLLDYEERASYLQLPLLAYIDPLLDKDTWLAFRASDSEIDADMQAAMTAWKETFVSGEDITIGNLLYVGAFGLSDSDIAYGAYYGRYSFIFSRSDDLLRAARILAPFLGDAYMEQDGDTHTISLNRLELFNIFRRFAEEETMYVGGFTDYAEFLKAVPAAGYTLRIREQDGAPASMELEINAKVKMESYDGEIDTVEFHYNVSAEARKGSVDYGIVLDFPSEGLGGSFVLHADAVSAPTDETPRTAPPDGAKIVSIDEL